MKKRGVRWKKLILGILISVLFAIVYTSIVNTGKLPNFFYVDIESEDIRGLIYSIWQVQVTMALISISLTTLIINKLDYMIYGQCISEILSISSRYKFNYIESIVYVIILSIVEVYFIINGNMPGLILLFIMSSYYIVKLIIDSYDILFNSEKYEERTLKNIDKYFDGAIKTGDITICIKTISNIKVHNLKMIDDNDINNLGKNIELIINKFNILYKYEKNKKNYNELSISLEKVILETANYLISNGYLDDVITLIIRIADNDIKYQTKRYLLQDIIEVLVKRCKYSNNENEIKKIIGFIINDVFVDTEILKIYEGLNVSDKTYFSQSQGKCFMNIYENGYLSTYTKSNIVDYYIYKLTPTDYENTETLEYFIRKLAMYYIAKYIIDSNDKDTFAKILYYIQHNNAMGLNLKEDVGVFEVIITLSIYIYYCVSIEEVFSIDKKNDIINFLNITNNDGTTYYIPLKEFVREIGVNIWIYYKNIKNEMPKSGWEKMFNGQVKAMLIPKSIKEFYAFYSMTLINDYDLEKLSSMINELDTCREILELINVDGGIKDLEVKDRFNSFVKIFVENMNDEQITEKIKIFYLYINNIYIKLLIEKQKEYYNSEEVCKSENKIIEDIITGLKNNKLYSFTKEEILEETELGFDLQPVDTSVLANKVSVFGTSFQKSVVNGIEKSILNILTDKSIKYKYSLKQSEKIKSLIKLINSCSCEFKHIINGKLSNDFTLKYNELEDSVKLLQKIDDGIILVYKLGTEVEKVKILLSNDNIDIRIKITQLEIKNIEDNQIQTLINGLNKVDNYYELNVVNNIKLLFIESDVIEYFNYKYKIAYIKYKLLIDVKDTSIISIAYE